jgi:hypothetical protein
MRREVSTIVNINASSMCGSIISHTTFIIPNNDIAFVHASTTPQVTFWS